MCGRRKGILPVSTLVLRCSQGYPADEGGEEVKNLRTVPVITLCLLCALVLVLAACGAGEEADPLLGTWVDEEYGVFEYEFVSDGTLIFRGMGEEEKVPYTAEGGRLSVTDPDSGETESINYRIEGDRLILSIEGEEMAMVRKE